MKKLSDNYAYYDYLRDKMILEEGIYVINTESNLTWNKATPKQIEQAKQRMKERIRGYD